MAFSFALVDGSGFSEEASKILEEAWPPPALHYSPEYLRWQLTFPSGIPMPSVAAFDGATPVGFAAASARRVAGMDVAVVSFVAVRPQWQGRGAASGLYRLLLQELADRGVPVVTYAMPGSGGEKAILKAYPASGFALQPLGVYSNYAFVLRPGPETESDWRAYCAEEAELQTLAQEQAHDASVLWSTPASPQLAHYRSDPRPRKVIVAEQASTGLRVAAFAVQAALRTAHGIAPSIILDSVWMPGAAIAGLHSILKLAAVAWLSQSDAPSQSMVMCPNLGGFDAAELRTIGLRKTGAQFAGYLAYIPGRMPAPKIRERTNLEIV